MKNGSKVQQSNLYMFSLTLKLRHKQHDDVGSRGSWERIHNEKPKYTKTTMKNIAY